MNESDSGRKGGESSPDPQDFRYKIRRVEIEGFKAELYLAWRVMDKDRQIRELESRLADREVMIREQGAAIQEHVRQFTELHQAYEIMARSLSMRITAPLRALSNLVRRTTAD